MQPESSYESPPGGGQFPVTHWTMVLEVARKSEDTRYHEALARFCEVYWGPLYNFVRRQGRKPEEAEDLTQAFFAHLLEGSGPLPDPAKGSFRSYLLRAMKNFMINEDEMAKAKMRYPGSPLVPFDAKGAETRFVSEPVDNTTPERIYERDCAWALVEKAIARLRARYEASGKLELYEQLKPTLMGDETALPYRELAEKLHTTEYALRSETCRMRKQLRKLLIQLLAPLDSSPDEVTEEINALFQALSR